MTSKQEKFIKKMAGSYKPSEKVGFIDKMKMTWYVQGWFAKLIYVLSHFALIYIIIRLIAGKGIW